MKVFSVFSGIGGFELGIERACMAKGLEPPVISGYSEIDKFALSVYTKHFKGVKNYGDIRTINERELPDFDCLVGGFPCQAFSLSGKRQGFNDERGALFFDIVRILRCKRPRLFVLENVKGLLSHDDGRTFKTIIATLAELGYSVEWQVLNSQTFGLPQSRERVIIIGHIGELGGRQVLPIHADTATYGGPTRSETGGQVRGIADAGAGIRVPEATKTGYTIAHRGDSVNLAYLGAKNKRGRVGKGFAHTLTASNMSQYTPVLDGDGKLALRRFTPTECERLQGFPDSWTAYGKDGKVMSDTQRYKLCGNAVTTNVIQAVFERLL